MRNGTLSGGAKRVPIGRNERRQSNEVKKEPATPREKSYPERRSGSTASRNEEKPSVRDTLERLKAVADKAFPHSERGKDKTR